MPPKGIGMGTQFLQDLTDINLLRAKRLFGLRGGAAAEEALRERDVGVEAILRATP